MTPMGLSRAALAEAMGVQRKHVNELCNYRRVVTAPTALILARVFGNSLEFWLKTQWRSDLWEAMPSPKERQRMPRRSRSNPPRRAFTGDAVNENGIEAAKGYAVLSCMSQSRVHV
ncbi:HigA family addiction module antidote protein [Methylocystis rosea]|uniref:HigA family addiction module antidote protein n=1 Tax=Methylocystis rosea TaxID=173366 RepID=A0ABX6EHY4_9HYPH|nr:HigA family addiction module antidote protein [Methylocystis rosea]